MKTTWHARMTAFLLPLALSLSLPGLASADVYKCQVGGKTVYQDHPCVDAQSPILTTPAQPEALRQESIRATVALIGQWSLPADYQQRIDTAIVHRLIDPDSRKIAYLGQPYGSAVCGTVNARNRMGGYTGQQPFVAYFDDTGSLARLATYTEKRFDSLQYFDDLDTYLFRRCGFLPPKKQAS